MKKQISFGQIIGAVTVASAMLAGCGGGGSDATVTSTTPVSNTTTSTPTPTPDPGVVPIAAVDGIYNGMTSNTNQAITALILADNHYYIMYSKKGDLTSFDGVAFGLGTANGSSFSGSFTDINLSGKASTGTLVSTYVSKQSFNGALGYDNSSDPVTSFSSAYDSSYATAPSLTTLAGVYTGTLAAGPLTAGSAGLSETGITLTILADGTMTGTISCGCKVDATITPLASGNAYGVRLIFGPQDHPLKNQTFTGSAYLNAVNKRLFVVGLLDASKAPAMFVGTKP